MISFMCLCLRVVCKINLQAYNSVYLYPVSVSYICGPSHGKEVDLNQYLNPTLFSVFWREGEVGSQNTRFHYNTVLSAAEGISLACCCLEFSLSKFLVGGEFSSWFDSAVKKAKLIFFFSLIK